jgi:hypothetical protein
LGTPSKAQSGSPGPPLLELLLTGTPLLEPLDPLLLLDPPLLLEPLDVPLLEPPDPLPLLEPAGVPPLEPDDTPLLDPPLPGGGAPSPMFGSTRPIQPMRGRPAKSTGVK